MTREVRYIFFGDIRRDVIEERREVDCLRANLSEQDLDRAGGASGRDGFPRIDPHLEKYERPWSKIGGNRTSSFVKDWGEISHGVESLWAAIVSSILASPQGASEQYICNSMSSLREKG